MKQYNFSDITREIFQIMLQDGMTYYTKISYKKRIEREINIFSNMLEVLSLWNFQLGKLDKRISIYLKCNSHTRLNLRGINLEKQNLEEINIKCANLCEAHLEGADLTGANLFLGKLEKAHLVGTNLSRANLQGVNFADADLEGAILIGANLSIASLKGANLNNTIFDERHISWLQEKEYDLAKCNVYIFETKETISYTEYCCRKQVE